MNILFVDDLPDLKIQSAIDYLKFKHVKFDYTICKSINSACNYIKEHSSEIDLAIIDFGLPMFDDGSHYCKYGGEDVIGYISSDVELDIPVIINSTSYIKMTNGGGEEEYFSYLELSIIKHVENLDGLWLYGFLEEHLREKLELL